MNHRMVVTTRMSGEEVYQEKHSDTQHDISVSRVSLKHSDPFTRAGNNNQHKILGRTAGRKTIRVRVVTDALVLARWRRGKPLTGYIYMLRRASS